MKNQKGFTLIELMIVLAILGVLFSITISNYKKYIGEKNKLQTEQTKEDYKKEYEKQVEQTIKF